MPGTENQSEATGTQPEVQKGSKTVEQYLEAIEKLLQAIEGQLKKQDAGNQLEAMRGELNTVRQQLATIEGRLKKLERQSLYIVVIAAFATVVLSALIIGYASAQRVSDVGIVTIGAVTLCISLVVIVFLMRYYGED